MTGLAQRTISSAVLAARLSETPGVVEHGLFSPALVDEILVGRGGSIERRRP